MSFKGSSVDSRVEPDGEDDGDPERGVQSELRAARRHPDHEGGSDAKARSAKKHLRLTPHRGQRPASHDAAVGPSDADAVGGERGDDESSAEFTGDTNISEPERRCCATT